MTKFRWDEIFRKSIKMRDLWAKQRIEELISKFESPQFCQSFTLKSWYRRSNEYALRKENLWVRVSNWKETNDEEKVEKKQKVGWRER